MVRETTLSPANFIYPQFVVHGRDVREEISSMPGVYHQSVDQLAREIEEISELSIPAVILFGVPAEKDPLGQENFADDGIVQQAIRAIRAALDEAQYQQVSILSYAVKYASGFYGPFREAVQSTPAFGDRRTHQMDPANVREALREAQLDVDEGADMLMVKPALAYLDVIRRVKDRFDLPLAAYNVSGEYSMIKAAAARGWLDERKVTLETLTAIRRAGADLILTYHAKDAARWLKE
jgi:porphobilinogen synthase